MLIGFDRVSMRRLKRSWLDAFADAQRRFRVDQKVNTDPPSAPEDARKSTEEQRALQEKLEHQDEDPDAPGLHQSRHNIADESTR